MADPSLTAPLLTDALDYPAMIAAAPARPAPAVMSAAGNCAVFVVIMLGRRFSFPTEEEGELSAFNVVINLAVTLAASVILTEVCSFLVVTPKNVRDFIEFIKFLVIFVSIVLIIVGFVFLAPDKSSDKSSALRTWALRDVIHPLPVLVILKCRGSWLILKDLSVAMWNKLVDVLQSLRNVRILSLLVVMIAIGAAILIIFN